MATLRAARGTRSRGRKCRSPLAWRPCRRWWRLTAWAGKSYQRHRIATRECRGRLLISCGHRRIRKPGRGYRRRLPRRVSVQDPHAGATGA